MTLLHSNNVDSKCLKPFNRDDISIVCFGLHYMNVWPYDLESVYNTIIRLPLFSTTVRFKFYQYHSDVFSSYN